MGENKRDEGFGAVLRSQWTWLITVLFLGIAAWVRFGFTLELHEDRLDKAEPKIDKLSEIVIRHDESIKTISGMAEDLKAIRRGRN